MVAFIVYSYYYNAWESTKRDLIGSEQSKDDVACSRKDSNYS
jgi:hypothetical protein